MKIFIKGYKELNKVAMTKAIKSHTYRNLKESKMITEKLLSDCEVEFDVAIDEDIEKLIAALKEANANVKEH